MNQSTNIPRISADYQVRQEGDRYIVFFGAYSLSVLVNASAMLLVSLMEPCRYTIAEIVERFAMVYAKPVEAVEADVLAVLKALAASGLITYELPAYEPPTVGQFDAVNGESPLPTASVRGQNGGGMQRCGGGRCARCNQV